ncbi:MAG: hypothetical protein Q9177_005346 [Variospora cf. flavescens]
MLEHVTRLQLNIGVAVVYISHNEPEQTLHNLTTNLLKQLKSKKKSQTGFANYTSATTNRIPRPYRKRFQNLREFQSDAAWLVPLCLQLIPGIALGIGMIFMPFSPRWLVHHGREAEIRKVLSSLRDLDQEHPLIELEFLKIKAHSVFEKRSTAEKWPHPQGFGRRRGLRRQQPV